MDVQCLCLQHTCFPARKACRGPAHPCVCWPHSQAASLALGCAHEEQSTREVLGGGNLGFKETMLNQKHDQKVEGKEMDA